MREARINLTVMWNRDFFSGYMWSNYGCSTEKNGIAFVIERGKYISRLNVRDV